ncbi:MAG: insulinase family protein [Erythrobacter sp.]|jgi:zinc protease|nr:insulinase family protein [Erythrobacter sp.]
MTFLPRALAALSLLAAPFALAIPSLAQDVPATQPAPAASPAPEIEIPQPRALQGADETPWLYEGSDVPVDREWRFGKMENGLRYVVRKNGVPPGQVSIRVLVDAGSMHERDFERGYAHLLEHLLFRESKYLGQAEAIAVWQRLGVTFGADANASTSPTQTVYKIDLPDASRAKLVESFKYVSGMVREPVLNDANVAAELPIVLAEKRERGGASLRIAELTRNTFFAGQRLAERSPIGIEETLVAADGAKLAEFHRRWYRPENTVVVIAGDADPMMLAGLVEQWFGDWEAEGEGAVAPDFGDPVAPEGTERAAGTGWPIGELAVAVEPDLPRNLTYAVMRPWRKVDDTIVYNEGLLLDTLATAIINRRLEARARRGGSYLYAQVQQDDILRSADATLVSFAPLTNDWQAALDDVRGVIADAIANPPTQEEIDREAAEFAVVFENQVEQEEVQAGSQLADNIVNAMDIRETVAAPKVVRDVFAGMKARLNPEEVLEHTRALFEGDVVRSVYVTPAVGEAEPEALRMALASEVESDASARLAAKTVDFEGLPAIGEPGTIVERKALGILEVEQINFDNGVRALVWASDAEPGRVSVKVRFGAGYRAFDADSAVYASLGEAALVGSGLADLGQDEIDRLATGRKLGFEFGVEDAVFTLSAQTRSSDLADQLYLFAAKLGMPRWDPDPVIRAKAALELAYNTYATSPGGILNRDLQYLVSDRDPRFATPGPEALAGATPEGFREVWEPLLKQGPIEVLVFGEFEKEAIVQTLAETFGALPEPEPIPPAVAARVPDFPDPEPLPTVLRHRGDDNQAAAVVAFETGGGLKALRESRQIEILTQIFNNRLLEALREEAGASYSPQVFSRWPSEIAAGGTITAIAQIEPELLPVFFSEADRIAQDLVTSPPSQDEIARVTEPLGQTIRRSSTGNLFWLYNLEGASFEPERVELLRYLLGDYSRTNPQIMQFLANRYFAQRAPLRLAVLPEGVEVPEVAPLAPPPAAEAAPKAAAGPVGPVQGPGVDGR